MITLSLGHLVVTWRWPLRYRRKYGWQGIGWRHSRPTRLSRRGVYRTGPGVGQACGRSCPMRRRLWWRKWTGGGRKESRSCRRTGPSWSPCCQARQRTTWARRGSGGGSGRWRPGDVEECVRVKWAWRGWLEWLAYVCVGVVELEYFGEERQDEGEGEQVEDQRYEDYVLLIHCVRWQDLIGC